MLFVSLLVFLFSLVCLNISNADVDVTTTGDEKIMNISDYMNGTVRCTMDGNDCVFQCMYSKEPWFNGTSKCFNVTVDDKADKTMYELHPCK